MNLTLRKSISPLLIFILFWVTVVLFDRLIPVLLGIEFTPISLDFYKIFAWILLAWSFGVFSAVICSKYLMFIASFFDRYKVNPKKLVRTYLWCMAVYLAFKVLEIYIFTGSIFFNSEALSLYRTQLTEDGVPSIFPFIALFNNFFFFFPCLIFFYKHSGLSIEKNMLYLGWGMYIFYIYLSTSRASVFVSFLTLFFFLMYMKVRWRYLLLLPFFLFVMFGVIGSLVGKDGFDIFFIYLFAPLHAFDQLINGASLNVQLLSFRPIQSIFVHLGFLDTTLQMIPYLYTPLPVNVFTVFGVYYYDFGLLGLLFFIFHFSFFSYFLYYAAIKLKSPRYLVLSSLSCAIIILGVFYDYYTSSTFVWLALPFVIWFFPGSDRVATSKA